MKPFTFVELGAVSPGATNHRIIEHNHHEEEEGNVIIIMNGHLPAQGKRSERLSRLFPSPDKRAPSLDEFRGLCSQSCPNDLYALASSIEKNIPVYDLSRFDNSDSQTVASLQDEWHHILYSGPGVLVLKAMYSPQQYSEVLHATNTAFEQIIQHERGEESSKGDHFGSTSGGNLNERIWNSFSKHALASPRSFLEYYSNPWLAHICEAWLGPGYKITAQANIVNPGGQPQRSHRDYHLGFQTAEATARYPRTIQTASQFLTLQGAVAHTDMPLESGPTRFLPFSQTFEAGYMAYRLPEFDEYFLQNWVSLPLAMGDGVFFNPALHHAAGENRTHDIRRSANLLQVSCAFGKTMETIDSAPLVERCWDLLVKRYQRERKNDGVVLSSTGSHVRAFVQAVADGYPFPTNLDRRPPAPNGMAPASEQDLLYRALEEGWRVEDVIAGMNQMRQDSSA